MSGRRRTSGVRLEDVARVANVSAMAVSRALRDPTSISAATRKRIADAIKTTGYVPNRIAGSLASSRTNVVLAIVPTIANSVHAETVQGLSEILHPEGFQVLLGTTEYSEAVETSVVVNLLGWRPSGVVLTGTTHEPTTVELLRTSGTFIVETWDLTDSPLDMAVGFSNFEAARAMTAHLLERGYSRIGFVGHAAPSDTRATARQAGFEAAMRERGAVDFPVVLAQDPLGHHEGGRALRELLGRAPDIEAAFFVSDVLAVGGLHECQRSGIDVPGRLAISGFGDSEMTADVNPPLTTVRVPRREIGRQAGRMLLDRIKGLDLEDKVVDLGFDIVPRQSA